MRNIQDGKISHSPGPVSIWETEDGQRLITDGMHRYVEAVQRGDSDIPVVLEGKGYSDIWAKPSPGEEFNIDQHFSKYTRPMTSSKRKPTQ